MKRFLLVVALLAAPAALAQQLAPGARVQVDIAGYKYQGSFLGYVDCPRRGDGKCARIERDHGETAEVSLRYVAPAMAGSARKALAAPAPGKYTCTFFSGTLQNVPGFTLEGGGRFSDHKGRGQWSYAEGVVVFRGGAWDGQKARMTGERRMQVLRENGSAGAVTCSSAK
jgi:hypothetical protein